MKMKIKTKKEFALLIFGMRLGSVFHIGHESTSGEHTYFTNLDGADIYIEKDGTVDVQWCCPQSELCALGIEGALSCAEEQAQAIFDFWERHQLKEERKAARKEKIAAKVINLDEVQS